MLVVGDEVVQVGSTANYFKPLQWDDAVKDICICRYPGPYPFNLSSAQLPKRSNIDDWSHVHVVIRGCGSSPTTTSPAGMSASAGRAPTAGSDLFASLATPTSSSVSAPASEVPPTPLGPVLFATPTSSPMSFLASAVPPTPLKTWSPLWEGPFISFYGLAFASKMCAEGRSFQRAQVLREGTTLSDFTQVAHGKIQFYSSSAMWRFFV